MRRRRFIRGVSQLGGISAVAGGFAGCIAHEDPPPTEAYLEDTDQWSDFGLARVDKTDTQRPIVRVGTGPDGRRFTPLILDITAGTTVVWKWTGRGGKHNVESQSYAFDFGSGSPQETGQYEHTFSERGIGLYHCEPHDSDEMKGAIGVSPPDSDTPANETVGHFED